MGYTLTTVAVGNAPLGSVTASLEAPDVAVTVSGVPEVTLPDTGVPYEVGASPEGGGALVAGGVVPLTVKATVPLGVAPLVGPVTVAVKTMLLPTVVTPLSVTALVGVAFAM